MTSSHQPKNYFFLTRILLQIPVPWIFVLTYLLGVIFQLFFPFNIFSQRTLFVIKIIGIVLFATGAFIAAWSLIIFHKARTTTTPGKNSVQLITKGPYQFTRNPMYVSLTLAYFGEAMFLAQICPIIVFPLMLLYLHNVVIPLEEEILKNDFKNEYTSYCNKVRRWI